MATNGTSGPDNFVAPAGSSEINGRGGIDTIVFNFRLVDAVFTWVGNQVIIDTATSHTVISGFEVFQFTDGTVHNDDGSPLIDDLFYYARNQDVWNAHVDADLHYNQFGWHEGRDPNAFFSTNLYLFSNPDVDAAHVNPLDHFDQFGWSEGRIPSFAFDLEPYLKANPDVAAAHVDPLAHFLQFGAEEGRQPFSSNGFDPVYYLQHNPDVAAAGLDPYLHFNTFGWKEGRNPNAYFDTAGYLATYHDVAAANVNPLDHFHLFGWAEGRLPSPLFDPVQYLLHNPDVAAAGIDPLKHFLQFGINEGRQAYLAPVFDTDATGNAVLEGAAAGTYTGVTASWDKWISPALTYTLGADSSGGGFAVDLITGRITVANGNLIDFETAPGHAYTVSVIAHEGATTTTQTFTIGVADAAPVVPTGNTPVVSINELAPNGTTVGLTYTVSDVNGPAPVYDLTDSAGGRFTINASTGVISVANGAAVDFETPTHTYTVTARGTVGSSSTSQTFTININNVNEAPAGADHAAAASEDSAYTFAAADFGFADPSDSAAPNAFKGVFIDTISGAGQLTKSGNPVAAGSFITAAEIAGGLLAFTPAADASGNGYASFTFRVQDDGGTASGGVDTDPSANTMTINVTPVNDAPTASPQTTSLTIDEDATPTALFTTAPVISDADSSNVTATLTVSAVFGTLGGAGTPVAVEGNLVYTITGTLAAVNAALAGVTYDSADNFNGLASVSIIIDDGANGPQGSNPNWIVDITVNPVNDAPTASPQTTTLTLGEDAAATALFTTAPVIADIDSTNVTATLTLADAAAGALTGAGAGSPSGGGLIYTITGTLAQVNAALAAVKFDSADDFNGSTSVAVAVDDGLTGPQGTNPSWNVGITINAVNDAPKATGLSQTLTLNEDAAAVQLFTVAPAISDIDSTNVTATLTIAAAQGTLNNAGVAVVNGTDLVYTITGTVAAVNLALSAVTYDSADNFNGPASVAIAVDDGAAGPQGTNPTGTVTITVNPVDDAPVAVNDAVTVNEDSGATAIDVLANDTDIDGGPKFVASITQPANGTVIITGGGTGLSYQPNANYANNPPGATLDTFTYTLNDGSTATVSVTVNAVDDAPVAVNDSVTLTEDDPATAINVLANDTDIDGGPKFIAAITQPSNGTVIITGGGTGLSYQPNANYANNPPGTTLDTFTYTLNDGSTATVSVTVNAVDDAPVAVNDSATISEDDGATAINVLGNDTDVDGGPKSILSVTQPANGTVVITGGGTGLTYMPDPDYNNTAGTPDTFTYTLNGGATATVSVIVSPVNDEPNLFAIDLDPSYTPGVQVFDFASVFVGPPNESAQQIDQLVLKVTNVGDDRLSIDGSDVNLTDGFTVASTSVNNMTVTVAVVAGTATVTVSKLGGIPAGAMETLVNGITYTNDSVGVGELPRDITIESIRDTGGAPGDDTFDGIAITSTVSFNTAPVANDDAASATEASGDNNVVAGTDPTGNLIVAAGAGSVTDTDAEDASSALIVVAVGTGVEGSVDDGTVDAFFDGLYGKLKLNADGSYEYQVDQTNALVQGLHTSADTLQDVFHYTIEDSGGARDSATFTVTIHGANDLPHAFNDPSATMSEDDTPKIFDVLLNDRQDPDSTAANTVAPGAVTVTSSAIGTVFVNSDATAAAVNSNHDIQVTLGAAFQQLRAGETATVSVPYTLTGDAGDTSSATLTVTVNGVNDGVVAGDDFGSMTEDQSGLAFTVITNDIQDLDHGAPNSITPSTVTNLVAPNGSIDAGDITLGVNGSKQITVTLGADFASMKDGETATFDVGYTLQGDQPGDTATATLHVTVNGVNDAPVAADFVFNTTNSAIGNTSLVLDNGTGASPVDPAGPQKTITGSLLTGATDVDGPGPLAIVAVTDALTTGGGRVTITADGDFTYRPAVGFVGNDTFTYTVSDQNPGTAGTDTGQVTINVATPRIWYVDATNGSDSTGDGTSDNPFKTLQPVNGGSPGGSVNDDVDGPGDIIYLAGGNYAGGIQLETGQTLWGGGEALVVNGVTLVAAGADAVITNATGNGVDLGSGNTIKGITVGDTLGFDIANNGSVGTLTVSNVDLIGTGGLFRATSGGVLNVTLDTATTTSASGNGIDLGGGLSGTFTATGGAIGGVAGTDVQVQGGTATVNIGSSISSSTNGSNGVINISQVSGAGSVTLSGAISITAVQTSAVPGISVHDNSGGTINFTNATKTVTALFGNPIDLANNTGAAINFTGGGLALSTGNGYGFDASNGGTITVTGSGNTISAAGGLGQRGINLDATGGSGVTIGNAGMTFDTVNVNSGQIGIHLQQVGQTASSSGIDILGGTIGVTQANGEGVRFDTVSADVSVAASLASSGSALRTVNVAGAGSNKVGGSQIVFSGAIDENRTGIILSNNDQNTNGATVTFSGNVDIDTIANSTGLSISNGGAVNVTGPMSISALGTGRGVDITGNAGGTVSFNSSGAGLDIDTVSGTGFSASGGIVTVQGASNTINSTSATALNVTGATIGANGLTFQSISSGTGTNSAGNGIVLDTTGSFGGLHVTGTGSAGSGGTIQHKIGSDGSVADGIGIYLNNTSDVQLAWMQLNDFANYAIRGLGVNGFTLNNSVVNGVNGSNAGFDEGAVIFGVRAGTTGLTGTASITNSTISGGFEDGLGVYNTSGTLNLTISGSTFSGAGNDGIATEQHTGGTINVDVKNSTFTNNIGDHFNAGANGAANVNVKFGTNGANTLSTSNPAVLGGSIVVQTGVGWSGTGSADISNNTITGAKDTPINVNMSGYGTFNARIDNNTIGAAGVPGSGTTGNEDAIRIVANGDTGETPGGTLNALLTNNDLYNVSGRGIYAIARDGGTGGDPIRLNLTIQQNTFNESQNANGQGIRVEAAATSTDDVVVHANIGGAGALENVFNGDWGLTPNGSPGIDQDEIRVVIGGAPGAGVRQMILTDYAGGATDTAAVGTYLEGRNNEGAAGNASGSLAFPTSGTFANGGPAPQPVIPLMAADGGIASASGASGDHDLSSLELAGIVQAAIGRWAATGLTEAQLSVLDGLHVEVADLGGAYLGFSMSGFITVDDNAAGRGWFIDSTPFDDAEFGHALSATQLQTDPSGAPAGQMDLLTVIMHEIGHTLGLDHSDDASGGDLMSEALVAGERRLPSAADAEATGDAGQQPEASQASGIASGFDAEYYLAHNPDVAAAGVDPLEHFNTVGWHEGRNPNAYFDTAGYLAHYADVAAAGVNPLEHYADFGWKEGRDPSAGFDTLGYLAANSDVAAAHVNPLFHYMEHGVYEGRTVVNDGLWH